jgi:hypothetical protein
MSQLFCDFATSVSNIFAFIYVWAISKYLEISHNKTKRESKWHLLLLGLVSVPTLIQMLFLTRFLSRVTTRKLNSFNRKVLQSGFQFSSFFSIKYCQ